MSTALLVIDCQVDFGSSDGEMARRGKDMTAAQAAVTKAEQLVTAARHAGMKIVFVRLLTPPDGKDNLCVEGTRGAEFIGPLPRAGEVVVSKARYSAFAHTGLDDQLHGQGVDTVVLSGLTTECCVASSAWDGFERDFHIVIAADACAAYDDGLHRHTLQALEMSGATLADSAELVAGWKNIFS